MKLSTKNLEDLITYSTQEACDAIQLVQEEEAHLFIKSVSQALAECFQKEKKVLIAGNGGSLCDAIHFAEELSGQFREKRKALSALALADPGHLTCVGNDMGFESVFSRAVEAHGKEGDILIVLTTSGNSENLLRAVLAAKERGLQTIAFSGKDGGKLLGLSDLEWVVPLYRYSDRIQEVHMTAIHIIIEALEQILFGIPKVIQNLVFDNAKAVEIRRS